MRLTPIVFLVILVVIHSSDGSIDPPNNFGSIINHVFSCDCFINQNDILNPFERLFQPLKPKKAKNPVQKNPKLVVIHPPRDKKVYNNNDHDQNKDGGGHDDNVEKRTDNYPIKSSSGWNPFRSFENIVYFLQESQQKLTSFLQQRLEQNDPTKFPHEESTESLFSLERGSITRNIVRLGRFLQLFDKFDCRCAGNISSIFNAQRFVRFTIAHV